MGAGAGSDLDELEELAGRINKTARTPVTTVRGDPLPEWLQPFDENLANNEGDEPQKREQQAAAPFAPASVAGAPTTSDNDDELVVDEEVIKEHDPDEQHGDRKIIKVHDPKLPTEEEMEVNEVNFDYGEFYDGWGEFAVDDITGAQLPP